MVDACGTCSSCREGKENYYEGPVGWTANYNGYMKPQNKDFNIFGGYSTDNHGQGVVHAAHSRRVGY